MTLFDDNSLLPPLPPDQAPSSPSPAHSDPLTGAPQPSSIPAELPLAGDPISLAAISPAVVTSPPYQFSLPEDLRISWSWPHLLVFLLFSIVSQFAIGIAALTYYSMARHLSQAQLLKFLETDPKVLVGTTILWFGLLLLFLYVTLSVLRGSPFWSSLGWKKLNSNSAPRKGRPWMYFLSGSGLSFLVAIVGSRVKDADHTPIQELFKNRTGAMLLMAMAVLVAPLVEETLFRGYLYPVLARIISSVAHFFGMNSPTAFRTGVASSIFLTGLFFGLLHAPQLGWTFGLVSLLTIVGVIFTLARAWTGTVLASFLLHLGYNSFLAVTSIIVTKGFTQMPPGN
jgi:membrane protease YdiL (CAAX protease family)